MYDAAVQNLIDELGRLPGVGPRSAQRIAFYILNSDGAEMEKLTSAINTVKRTVSFCEICGNVSETKLCAICRDERRDPSAICVVEEPKDVVAVERTRSFNGRYHVLGGAINPLAGFGPEQLRIRELVARLSDERIQELILAMDPNLEGEATATYLSRLLVPLGIRVSRLASGLPVGGDLEYADEITLGRALEGRRIISEGNRGEPEHALEDFEEAVEEEAEERATGGPTENVGPSKRWSGSMFDDLGSDNAAPTKLVLESEIKQTSLNEPLIEQALEESSAFETDEGEVEAKPSPVKRSLPGELSPAEAEAEKAYFAKHPETKPNEEDTQRRASYDEKLEELKKTPLRTAKPEVPPIPGATYVNPWG
ncbi:recombination mediator RecR [uncultured Rothia sp.]|uniref:recombination mediator RecR n=1 Tax=uncultured Rothia sp. TaxID=316088 RepID=UPI0032165235